MRMDERQSLTRLDAMRRSILAYGAAWLVVAAIGVAAGAVKLGGAGSSALTWFVIALLALTICCCVIGMRAARIASHRWDRATFFDPAPHRSWFVLPLLVVASLLPLIISGAIGWAVLRQINSQRRWELPATLVASWVVAGMLIACAVSAATALDLARRR